MYSQHRVLSISIYKHNYKPSTNTSQIIITIVIKVSKKRKCLKIHWSDIYMRLWLCLCIFARVHVFFNLHICFCSMGKLVSGLFCLSWDFIHMMRHSSENARQHVIQKISKILWKPLYRFAVKWEKAFIFVASEIWLAVLPIYHWRSCVITILFALSQSLFKTSESFIRNENILNSFMRTFVCRFF